MKKEKKQAPVSLTAKVIYETTFGNISCGDILKMEIQNYAIEFAKLKVTEALHETSKHFKNPENVSHVLNHYKLDKII